MNEEELIKIHEQIKDHMEIEKSKNEYLQKIENANMNDYDMKFVNLYRFGKVIIQNKEHNIEDLYIEVYEKNNQKIVLLTNYLIDNYDLLTSQPVYFNPLEREDIMLFRYSECFYEIYKLCQNEIIDNKLIINKENINLIKRILYSYDGKMNINTPETRFK